MVYHFVKNIGIDVEADTLEQAMQFACDIDNYDDNLEDDIACTLEDSDYIDDIDSYDVHTGYTEYAGYTEDADEEDSDAEEDFYNHLTEDADDADEPDEVSYGVDAIINAIILGIISSLSN